MRKLTGYIGALIVVMALMGSILAGYALNITGTDTNVNAYDPVTDVSGLYSHTQEPSYIDYTPARNYTGYNLDYTGQTIYYSTPGYQKMKTSQSENITITINLDGSNVVNGTTYTAPNEYYCINFICDKCYVQYDGGNDLRVWRWDSWPSITTSPVTITVSGSTISVTFDGNTYTYTDNSKILYYVNDTDNFDHYMIYGKNLGNTGVYTAYTNSFDDIITVSNFKPGIGLNTGDTSSDIITIGNQWYGRNLNNGNANNGQSTIPAQFTDYTEIANGVYSFDPNYSAWVKPYWGSPPIYGTDMSCWFSIYPAKATASTLLDSGISYDTTTRYNNYPIYDYNDVSITSQMTSLYNLNLTDYLQHNAAGNQDKDIAWLTNGTYTYTSGGNTVTANNLYVFHPHYVNSTIPYKNYQLKAILNTLTIPAGTFEIKITADMNGNGEVNGSNTEVQLRATQDDDLTISFYRNTAIFNTNEYQTIQVKVGSQTHTIKTLALNNQYNNKDYIIYNVVSDTVDFYNASGVKYKTVVADNCYIAFCDINYGNDTGWNGNWYYTRAENINGAIDSDGEIYPYSGVTQFDFPWLYSFIRTEYHYSNAGNVYMDVSKGVSINNTDPNYKTIWSNGYDNSHISIIFRAENVNNDYSNELTVNGNSITVSYTGGRYSVILNGAYPVDIGTWRNILLDIDLANSRLSVTPIKTFNSYTNVELYNTPIEIGTLTGAGTTTSISWAAAAQSFRFSIYTTDVFMNTYGVVMVNPELNITDYFTDLNDFYRLNLTDFAVYGDSITINGQTANVINGTVTYNDETIRLNDIDITYADGHTYIGDNNLSIDLGTTTDYAVSATGNWYFTTELEKGHTEIKKVYDWNWGDFIFNNTQFVVFYMGFAIVGLIIARRFCNLSVTDYIVFSVSIILALTLKVIA